MNPPRIIVLLFMAVPLAVVSAVDVSMTGVMNDTLIKWAMNGVIVLSLTPMINVGAGRNFSMSIDLSAELVGMMLSVNARYMFWTGFFYSMFLGTAVALLFGHLYAKILNHSELNEEIMGTFAGYSLTPIMNLFYIFVSVTNRQMLCSIGNQGLRPKANLGPYLGQILDRLQQVRIGELVIPVGLLLSSFGTGFPLWLFSKTKIGMIFSAIAENERFVRLASINVNGCRTAAITMSTVIAAAEVVVYSQSYGVPHLYDDSFMMSFPAVSAIIIGGANPGKTTVANALIGIFLYQTTCLLSIPVANALLIPETAEVMGTIITSRIILYAFIFEGKDIRNEAH